MKIVLIIIFISFIDNAFSSDCVKRLQVLTQKKTIFLGEPFSAKIIFWNKNCFNIDESKKSIIIKSKDMYIHKISNISLSKNNSDVIEVELIAIHLNLIKNNSLIISINNITVQSDKIKYIIQDSDIYKKIKLFDIPFMQDKYNYIYIFFGLFIIILIALIIFIRKKSLKKETNIDLVKFIKNSSTINELIKLSDYKKEINNKYTNTYQFFNYLNDIQYKKNITTEEESTLKEYKALFSIIKDEK